MANHGIVWHAALVRVLGEDAAEIPIVATRPQLRTRGLAKRLLAAVEGSLKGAGVTRITMPAMRAPGVPSLSVLPCPFLAGYCVLCYCRTHSVQNQSCCRLGIAASWSWLISQLPQHLAGLRISSLMNGGLSSCQLPEEPTMPWLHLVASHLLMLVFCMR